MKVIAIDEIINGFHFRRVTPQDKDSFMRVRSESSDVAEFDEVHPDFLDFNWNLILKDENEISMVAFQLPDERFVGTCSFQGVQKEDLELGYDIVKELRGYGIGTQMVGALFKLAHKHFPDREIFVRIRNGNIASQRVAEKNGAEFVHLGDPPEVIALQKLLDQNPELPNDAQAREMIEQGRNGVRVYRA